MKEVPNQTYGERENFPLFFCWMCLLDRHSILGVLDTSHMPVVPMSFHG